MIRKTAGRSDNSPRSKPLPAFKSFRVIAVRLGYLRSDHPRADRSETLSLKGVCGFGEFLSILHFKSRKIYCSRLLSLKGVPYFGEEQYFLHFKSRFSDCSPTAHRLLTTAHYSRHLAIFRLCFLNPVFSDCSPTAHLLSPLSNFFTSEGTALSKGGTIFWRRAVYSTLFFPFFLTAHRLLIYSRHSVFFNLHKIYCSPTAHDCSLLSPLSHFSPMFFKSRFF